MFLELVKTIAIYIVLITIVMNLLGQSSFKKYVNLFSGILLIWILFSSLLKMINISDNMEYYLDKNLVAIEAKEISLVLDEGEESKKNIILQQYKEKIQEQVEKIVNKEKLYTKEIKIEMNEEDSDLYGSILSMDIVASYIALDKEDTKKIKNIEKVKVDGINIKDLEKINRLKGNKESKKDVEENVLKEEKLAEKISEFYEISRESVNVTVAWE